MYLRIEGGLVYRQRLDQEIASLRILCDFGKLGKLSVPPFKQDLP